MPKNPVRPKAARPKPVEVTPQQLAPLMAQFGKGLRRWLHSELEQAGTTPARARLLMTLACQGECKMSEVGVHLGVTPRNVTGLVDALETEGLVVRAVHPRDRRATLLRLTERGLALSQQSFLCRHPDTIAGLYAELSPADRRHLARIVRQLIAGLARRLPEPPDR